MFFFVCFSSPLWFGSCYCELPFASADGCTSQSSRYRKSKTFNRRQFCLLKCFALIVQHREQNRIGASVEQLLIATIQISLLCHCAQCMVHNRSCAEDVWSNLIAEPNEYLEHLYASSNACNSFDHKLKLKCGQFWFCENDCSQI